MIKISFHLVRQLKTQCYFYMQMIVLWVIRNQGIFLYRENVSILERAFATFDTNHLALNLPISSYLFFSRSGTSCLLVQTISTTHGDITRPHDRHVRFLGILLNKNLSFKRHCALVKSSLGTYEFFGSFVIVSSVQ